jgi:phosphoribosyl-ATP pyrophosphohydrolase
VIETRRRERPEKSYVVSLLDGGVAKIGAKVTEEAAELVEAAGTDDHAHTVREAADLVFHSLVLLAARGIRFAEVEAELARRFGIGGFAEKAARPKKENP